MAANQNKTGTGWNLDNSYLRLPESFYTKMVPQKVRAPKIVAFNEALADRLGLDAAALQTEEGTDILAGSGMPEGAASIAQAYAGHQFGSLNMLGDGRALLVGEQITPAGERFDIQLKGSGRTPYSRGGDGRAALGPMLREFIMSEAMHALGIPTSRSLAVVLTGETIRRETMLPGAVLTRVAASHLRFGTFQYASFGRPPEELKALADYAWERHFTGIQEGGNRYESMFREVVKRHASLVAKWQSVGFIHGVMNTDNMTISGETIDYGPCAFMNAYDPATVFSSIDTGGRYAYGNQPQITGWNLARFAESLLPLLHEDQEAAVEIAQQEMSGFMELYEANWLGEMRAKLGLFNELPEDETLVQDLLQLMRAFDADYTNTFRALSLGESSEPWMASGEFREWHGRWETRTADQEQSSEEVLQLMRRTNPAVIPRNHRVEEALTAAVERDDYTVMNWLIAVLSDPFAYSDEQREYAMPDDSDESYQTFCGT